MPIFTSSQEKRFWLYAFIVLVAIISTLVIGQPLIRIFANQNVQAIIFVIVMLLVGATMILHGIKTQPKKTEITIWLGLTAVYIIFFLRLGLPERSHLMEYSVLAIFIHMALIERGYQENKILKPALLAFVITFLIGVLDESVQLFLPERVFDTDDIIFNGFAALMAIASRLFLQWVQKKLVKQ